jgi:gliding motility-associated lipoprotein GldH
MKHIVIILSVMSFIGCSMDTVVERNIEFPDMVWTKSNELKFNVPIEDTTKRYKVSLLLRYGEGYPFTELKTKIRLTAPSGVMTEFPFTLEVRDEKGKYKGEVAGDLWDVEGALPISSAFATESGKYTISVIQDMAWEKIPMVIEIGIRVQKVVEGQETNLAPQK